MAVKSIRKKAKPGLKDLLSNQERSFTRVPIHDAQYLSGLYENNTMYLREKNKVLLAMLALFLEDPRKYTVVEPDLKQWTNLFNSEKKVISMTILENSVLEKFKTFAAATFRDQSNALAFIYCSFAAYCRKNDVSEIVLDRTGKVKFIKK